MFEVAEKVTRTWPRPKALMARRAAGLDPDTPRTSLDAIAKEADVSRETVRRARNQLLKAMAAETNPQELEDSGLKSAPGSNTAESPATPRALRRMLTMTGPLHWDELLAGWARGGGRYPWAALPTSIVAFRQWAGSGRGIFVSETEPFIISVSAPEALDRVSVFLSTSLRDRPDGIERTELLEAAEAAGLKATTVSTALSMHPAILRQSRGNWALRTSEPEQRTSTVIPAARMPRPAKPRPTTFQWSADGDMIIEFSIPRSPSPVIAVPKAIAELVEGREFTLEGNERPHRVTVSNARLWGFGPSATSLGIGVGQRAQLRLNLIAATAIIEPQEI